MTMRFTRWILLLPVLAGPLPAPAGEQPQLLELWNETVCYVNNERIAKRDVEQAIDPMIMARLEDYRRRMMAAGNWTAETQRQYHDLLMPDFRRELRNLVRQKLMLQEAKEKKLEIDKVNYQKRLDKRIQDLRQYGVLGKPGFTLPEVREFVREQMLIQEFQSTLVTALDLPNKPQVQKYYHDHQSQYMRPPMVKLRIIKVNAEGGGSETPYSRASELRKDVVDYGINFADLAREKSDDPETRARSGLMVGPEGEPYIDPEQNRVLAPIVRKLGVGSVAERTSKVFEMDNGWAIVFLEERRPAGPAELDSALYDKIRETLIQEVVKRKEKEWFLAALKRSLVLDGSPNPKPIPVTFFFPDDPTVTDDPKPDLKTAREEPKTTQDKGRTAPAKP